MSFSEIFNLKWEIFFFFSSAVIKLCARQDSDLAEKKDFFKGKYFVFQDEG